MPVPRLPLASIAVSVPVFAALGAASRYHFRTIETRWQIAAFVAVAAAAEAGWYVLGARPSWARWVLSAGAAGAAITFAKFDVEPAARHAAKVKVEHVARHPVAAVKHAM